MAVTRIRKISSWTLWAVAAVSIGVLGLFFFGGNTEYYNANMEALKNPLHTDELLYWGYSIFGLAIVLLICFAIFQFITSFMTTPKKALTGLSVIVVFIVMLGVAYSMGDTTPLSGINADSEVYNIPKWLKITDMWLYTMYVMFILCIVASLGGSFIKVFRK